MANKDIPTLPGAHGLDGSESFHGNQGADSREITAGQIATYVQGFQRETHLTRTTDQAISDALENDVLWTTETRDEGNWHDTGSNTDRVTTGAGVFDAVAKIRLITLATNGPTFEIRIGRYNSSDVLQEYVAEYASSNEAAQDPDIAVNALNIRMNSGDFLRVTVQSSDTTYSVESDDSYFMVRTAGIVPIINGFSGARVTKSAVQSMADGVDETLTWDQEDYDTHIYHDNSTNNTRLTAPEAGIYRVSYAANLESFNGTAVIQAYININGGAFPGVATSNDYNDGTITANHGEVLVWTGQLAVGDYVEAHFFQNSAGAHNMTAGLATWFAIERLDGPTFVGGSNQFSGAKVSHTTNQSITSSASVVDMANVVYDTDNYHVSGANDHRLTVPVAGYYVADGLGSADAADKTDFYGFTIYKNGATLVGISQAVWEPHTTSNGTIRQSVTTGVIFLSAGDYVELRLAWNPTKNAANGEESTSLAIRLVGRPSGGVGADLLEDLSDVDLATQAPGLYSRVTFDGTNWVPIGGSYCLLSGKVESFTHNVNKVTVWTEDEDTDAYFGGGTVADEHVVFPFTGRYFVKCKITLASASTTDFIWQVVARLNRGATTTFNNDFIKLRMEGRVSSTSNAVQRTFETDGFIDVTAADELDFLLFHFGATRNLSAESTLFVEYRGPTPV